MYSRNGPFFLGNLRIVDFVYAPFIEQFEIAFGGITNYDIKAGRPSLTNWIEAMDNVEAYASTKVERYEGVKMTSTMQGGRGVFDTWSPRHSRGPHSSILSVVT